MRAPAEGPPPAPRPAGAVGAGAEAAAAGELGLTDWPAKADALVQAWERVAGAPPPNLLASLALVGGGSRQ